MSIVTHNLMHPDSAMHLISKAVRAGAFKQATELLRAYRAGELSYEAALTIRLSTSWDYPGWERVGWQVSPELSFGVY